MPRRGTGGEWQILEDSLGDGEDLEQNAMFEGF